jgi:hypothetical protein
LALASSLTTPKRMPERSDAAFEDILRDSSLFGICRAMSRATQTAWQHAVVNRSLHRLRLGLGVATAPGADPVRIASIAGVAGGVTALLLQALGPAWIAPFIWILPAVAVLLGCVAFFAAEPLSRAMASRFP